MASIHELFIDLEDLFENGLTCTALSAYVIEQVALGKLLGRLDYDLWVKAVAGYERESRDNMRNLHEFSSNHPECSSRIDVAIYLYSNDLKIVEESKKVVKGDAPLFTADLCKLYVEMSNRLACLLNENCPLKRSELRIECLELNSKIGELEKIREESEKILDDEI